ncbi:hypothetical protein KDU71_21375, partial [Carboxylicivirga sediminis]
MPDIFAISAVKVSMHTLYHDVSTPVWRYIYYSFMLSCPLLRSHYPRSGGQFFRLVPAKLEFILGCT